MYLLLDALLSVKGWKSEPSPRESRSLAGAWIAGRKTLKREAIRVTEFRNWEEVWPYGMAVKLEQAVLLESTSPGQ